ncbi:MAG: potassium-transporting ATPase subunit B, partial [Chromatiaceae bacterium]
MKRKQLKLLDTATLVTLAGDSLLRLDPRRLAHNPVMLVVGVGTLVTLGLTLQDIVAGRHFGFDLAVTLILLLTVLFATRLTDSGELQVPARDLRVGDRVRVKAGELIPADGEILEGAASINES